MRCSYTLSSGPPSGSGAIAIIELRGEIDTALERLGIRAVGTGQAVLRSWPDVDTIVVARTGPEHALLFPHAGIGVFRRVERALNAQGILCSDSSDARELYPEAASELEARMLAALARAASPLAIDLLLDQPARWASTAGDPERVLSPDESRVLKRLIDPPLIVALGPPNIGKSSLLNALAGRTVAIVADAPGTTRDHVGVQLDLAGLVVRYVDTPGIGATIADLSGHAAHAALDADAQRIALGLARAADLVILCADASAPAIGVPDGVSAPLLRVGLRNDLGRAATPVDIEVSVRTGSGLASLTARIRDLLLPPPLLSDPRAWTFW